MIYSRKTISLEHYFNSDISYYNSFHSVFFHCISTGHFWRNSQITELSLLYETNQSETTQSKAAYPETMQSEIIHSQWVLETWRSEQESDEYDMLLDFSKKMNKFTTIIGFNSNSFHIPYLEHKLFAYGIPSPFTDKIHYDQLPEIKKIGKSLHISTKLNDLRIFLHLPDTFSEIECIAAFSQLYLIKELLSGKFSVQKIENYENEILFFCQTDAPFPTDLRIHDTEFYLIGHAADLKIKVKTINNKLKLYYSNYTDYYYLPDEGIVIHKSLSSAIHKDKKQKATLENCFSYIVPEQLLNNLTASKKYLIALLNHFMQ